jgi:TrmH family RNA methyltransferase
MSNPLDRLRVVLVSTRNPLNIGAAARAMSNFGATNLNVVNPYDVAFREARSAVGAAHLLKSAKEFKSVAEAIANCTLVVGTTTVGHRELQHPIRRLEQGARLIRQRLRTSQVALLFGSEKVGLSNHDLAHCHWLMRIPTRDEHASMNLAQAVAVCLYELVRTAPRPVAREKKLPAKGGDLDRIAEQLFGALSVSGYVKPRSASVTEEKLRRLIRRLDLDARDAETLLGMLRQIAWKLAQYQR